MRLLLLTGIILGFLFLGSVQAQTLGSNLASPNQGFYGLDSQSGPAAYAFTLPEKASYLFASILVKEGTASMELQDASGYSYGLGQNVIAVSVKPGAYTLTVNGSGKYIIFWDYMPALDAAPAPGPSLCQNIGDRCSQQAAGAVKLSQPVCGSGWGYGNPISSNCPSTALYRPGGPDQEAWFLVDPSAFGITFNSFNMVIRVYDYSQGAYGTLSGAIYSLDASNNITMINYLSMENNMGKYTDWYYSPNNRYLVKTDEIGQFPIAVTWNSY